MSYLILVVLFLVWDKAALTPSEHCNLDLSRSCPDEFDLVFTRKTGRDQANLKWFGARWLGELKVGSMRNPSSISKPPNCQFNWEAEDYTEVNIYIYICIGVSF